MKVLLKLHGGLGEAFEESFVEVAENSTVEDIFYLLAQRNPSASRLLEKSLVAVNEKVIGRNNKLNENEVLHIMPPFSGG